MANDCNNSLLSTPPFELPIYTSPPTPPTGYPTIKYFENGEFKYEFGGDRTKKGILEFMKNPGPPAPPPPPEPAWSEVPSSVHHLTDSNFNTFFEEHPSTLVMFYAPWYV